jgi:hypothetical protein
MLDEGAEQPAVRRADGIVAVEKNVHGTHALCSVWTGGADSLEPPRHALVGRRS